jgi:hypothetical protein
MRSRLALAARLVLSGLLLALQASAQPSAAPASSASASDTTEAARARFKTGTRLYQDQNFEGALAEFEAAYELKPGPGSLQNVALCQKALARYGEAVDTLTQLLTLHAAELSGTEQSAVKRARDELEALVGAVRLVVVPPSAEVTVDGRVLSGVDRSGRLRLNAGEHTLSASAPGYTRVTTSIQVASGQREASVNLTLKPNSGFIDVTSADPHASIAVDGKPVGFGHIVATVTPDEEHVVQIYKDGSAPFEARVTVKLGETAVVNGQPGAANAPGAAPSPVATAPNQSVEPAKPALGWYAVGSASLLATGATPFRFDLATAKSSAGGLGVHVGRRFWPAVAIEGLLEYQVLKVRHACDERAGQLAAETVLCSDPDAVLVNYMIRSFRFGPSLQLMTTDPRLRAVGGIGTGAVWHELRLGLKRSAGVDPYLLLELGIAANTKHALFTLVLQTLVDGTRQMISGRYLGAANEIHEDAFDRSGRALAYVGVNLRVGYSQWSP